MGRLASQGAFSGPEIEPPVDSGHISGTRKALQCFVDGRSRTEVEKIDLRPDAIWPSRDSALKLTPQVERLPPLRLWHLSELYIIFRTNYSASTREMTTDHRAT